MHARPGLLRSYGIVAEPDDALADATDKVFDRQLARCATAADIFQACTSTQTKTTCWLITANAAGSLLPKHTGATPAASLAADSALWGFGRTMLKRGRPLCHPPD
jgi:phthiocerol/phenolphthiocerol synthesis type-I polyketide synthase C